MDRATMEKLVEMSSSLTSLTNQVNLMDKKLDELRTSHAQETATELAVTKTKVDRLERVVYGIGGLCVVEGVALLVQVLSN